MILLALYLTGSMVLAGPLEQNAVTRAHAKQLQIALGEPIVKIMWMQDGANEVVEQSRVIHTYYFEGGHKCVMIFEANERGLISDVSASSEYCFGKHKFDKELTSKYGTFAR